MKLVIFDCDGTLVDSQHAIVATMNEAFTSLGLVPPSRSDVLGVVGLSLPEAFDVLAPEHDAATRAELARRYKGEYAGTRRRVHGIDPLYEGAREAVLALAARDDVVLGIATGKSRRGVARLFDQEGWHPHFLTVQTADDHPSKPHPSMIARAMAEAGVGPARTVMIGDTSFDMAMARNATVAALGVSWGYHPRERLDAAGAHRIIDRYGDLLASIDHLLGEREGPA